MAHIPEFARGYIKRESAKGETIGHRDYAHLLDAKANFMREQRLAAKQDHLHAVGKAAAKLENGRTQDALGKLGAGKNYGQN